MKITCPRCGEEATKTNWYDEAGIVEINIVCKCGYHYNWAYGYTITNSSDDNEEE